MLPPFIIEQIRQREERQRQRRRDNNRPRLELPIEQLPAQSDEADCDDDPERGVIIVDLLG